MPSVPSVPSTTTTSTLLEPAAYKAALDARKPALYELPESRIYRRSRLDPHAVHQLAMGAALKLSGYRAVLVAQFGATAAELVDSLPGSALTAKQAHIELEMAQETNDLTPQHRALSEAYTILMTDADSLANRGHLPRERLGRVRDIRGYQPLIDSTMKLVSVLRDHWTQVTGITPITMAEVTRAENAALSLNRAMAARDQGAARAPAAELRVRALSQLIYEYDQLRRMMTYIRWTEGDVDQIVPSLYAGRGRRRATEVEPEDVSVGRDDVDVADDSVGGPSPATPSPISGPPFITET